MSKQVILAIAAIVALTVVPALIEGKYVNRWGTPPDLESAAKRVESFPREFGNWTSVEDGEPLSPEVCRELGLVGYLTRIYKHRETGQMVRVLLMVGQSGPLLRHPPNICYANVANEQIGDMTKLQLSTTNPTGQFNLLEYKRAQSIANDRFLVAYSLASDATWKVPSMPRIEFGAAPLLYKVQLLTSLDPSQSRDTGVAILKQFAEEFSAAFQTHVHPPDETSDHKSAT